MINMDNVLSVILGGGRGSRLYPLTKLRSKPAVPIGGKYRLIDIPISNCINSGIYRMAVLTQFNSVSLHRHITQTYHFDVFHTGWVHIWAAEQTMEHGEWYQGTADAVRKQISQIRSTHAEHVLILAGDHLYRMDFREMARIHFEQNADVTVAVQPVLADEASRFGILKVGAQGRIVRFVEKPKKPEDLADLVSRPDDPAQPYLGSMGIYLFKTEALIHLLEETDFEDFGKQVIPHAMEHYNVFSYGFEGYWVDIGTIRSFYETNLEMAEPNPRFNLFDPQRPIFSHPRFLPGSIVADATIENSLLAEGCCLKKCEVRHSIIGLRSQVRSGTILRDTILMGSDYFEESCNEDCEEKEGERPALGIGRNCFIEGAIIDKNARIGSGVTIRPFPRGTEISDRETWFVQDGIVVIPKNAVIPPGTVIAP